MSPRYIFSFLVLALTSVMSTFGCPGPDAQPSLTREADGRYHSASSSLAAAKMRT